MPRYTVNVTLSLPAWVDLEAENPVEAEYEASQLAPMGFEYDINDATLDSIFTPVAEVA